MSDNLRTDKEILDYLESFDCVHVEATHDILQQFPKFIAMGDKFTGPGIRQALSDAMDRADRHGPKECDKPGCSCHSWRKK